METKPRLGRGLSALLGEAGIAGEGGDTGATRLSLPADKIERNPYQPRQAFADDEIASLAESIRAQGLLQPLVVRLVGEGYQLIAGERRLRACQVAGLAEVPVTVVEFTDQQVLEAALVENIQRVDLNPIEKARSFKDYLDRYAVTQEQLAQRLGMDRTSVSNLVNLLNLPDEVQGMVRSNQISLGHAKILKGMGDPAEQLRLAKKVMLEGMSVKALDATVREAKAEKPATGDDTPRERQDGPAFDKTPHVLGIETELRQKLATRFEIKLKAKDRGQIIINFETTDDFERVVEALRR